MRAPWLRGRRLLTVPAVVLVELLVLATAPITLAVAALAGLVARTSRPLRSVALLAAYSVIELRALGRVARGVDDWDTLVRDVLDAGYRAMRRILDVRIALEEGSATTAQLETSDGLVVLARHCGPGDSLFIAWLLTAYHGLSLRIVLKQTLRWEPAIDVAGDHLPLCFVGHGGDRARQGVRRLAGSLRSGQALLLFPEGGNFTWQRWTDAIRALTARGEYGWAHRARGRTHTLPPRPGGALGALAEAPQADVLLLAHSGFGPDGRGRDWWRLPVHDQLVIRTVLVPAADVPREEDAARRWLDDAWAQVDTWVEGHTELAPLLPRGEQRG